MRKEVSNNGSIQTIWMMLPEASIACKELIQCKCTCKCKKKNVPKEVVAKNKILNAQNFMNLVKGVEANKNISTIKTSFCSIN